METTVKYLKGCQHYYREEGKTMISVCVHKGYESINVYHWQTNSKETKPEESNEKEFNNAFLDVTCAMAKIVFA